MRKGSSFEKVIQNTGYLLEEEKSLGKKYPFLAIQIIKTKITVKEIEDFRIKMEQGN